MTTPQPDPDLAGAGLSATGRTADDLSPGDPPSGTTYGGPAGAGAEGVEAVEPDPDEDGTAQERDGSGEPAEPA